MLIYWSVGWDSDMSAILLLLHLLPPSAQGRKRPGKISASQAVDHLIRFQKVYETVFENTFHHINLIYSLRWSDLMSFVNHQMLLLNVFCFRLEPACNNIWTTSPKAVSPIFLRRDPPEAAFTHTSLWSTSTHFHARQRGQWEPLMNSLKPITSFGTSYSSSLSSFFTFVQTTIYNIDIGETKETPRIAELRARMLHWVNNFWDRTLRLFSLQKWPWKSKRPC